MAMSMRQLLLAVVIGAQAAAVLAQPTLNHAQLDAAAAKVLPDVVNWRRDLHAHPELAFDERRTSDIDPALTAKMLPSLRRVAGAAVLADSAPSTTSEDFSFYGQRVPALLFFLGVNPAGTAPADWAPNHSPRFNPDEGALLTGVRSLASLAADFLTGN
jgi:metal-dependent amidase/aminoacylase/carboxypeptidase family protein